jgi:hypothetical protein
VHQDFFPQESSAGDIHNRAASGGFNSSALNSIDPRSNAKAGTPGTVPNTSFSHEVIGSRSPQMPEGESDRGSTSSHKNESGNDQDRASSEMQRQYQPYYPNPHGGSNSRQQLPAQVVMGPDGQYTYVIHPTHFSQGGNAGGAHPPGVYYDPQQQLHPAFATYGGYGQPQAVHPHQGHHIQGPHGQQQVIMPSYIDARTGYPVAAPIYVTAPHQQQRDGSIGGRGTSGRGPQGKRMGGGGFHGKHGGGGDQDLALDIEAVRAGGDNRTSLMVRNIPNK